MHKSSVGYQEHVQRLLRLLTHKQNIPDDIVERLTNILERIVHHRIRQVVARARVAASKRLVALRNHLEIKQTTKMKSRDRAKLSFYLKEVQELRVLVKQLDRVMRSFRKVS